MLSHNNRGGGRWESGGFIISECCSLITMSPSSLAVTVAFTTVAVVTVVGAKAPQLSLP